MRATRQSPRFRWLAAVTLLLAAASVCSPVPAATFPDLYVLTVVPDASATGDLREAAIRSAMGRLLERVTGERSAALDPQLASLIEDAGSYMRSYATLEEGKVRVGFIQSKVNAELARLGWPVWGPERPLTLVWIAIDGGQGERMLLSAGDAGANLSPRMMALAEAIRGQIADVADERGLPVVLPLLDLQDLGHIAFADVWGGFDERIREASARYGADALLIGRVLQTDLGISAQWTLLRGNEQRVAANESVAEGLEWLADQYAQEFSVVGGLRTLRMIIHGVRSVDDYGRIMSYLNDLTSLQRVDVEGLADGVLSLKVASRGDRQVLARTVELGHVLVPVADSSDNGENGSREGAPAANGGATGETIILPGDKEAGMNTLVLRVATSESNQ